MCTTKIGQEKVSDMNDFENTEVNEHNSEAEARERYEAEEFNDDVEQGDNNGNGIMDGTESNIEQEDSSSPEKSAPREGDSVRGTDESKDEDNNENIERITCIREDLEGSTHPDTGVPYEKRMVEIDGQKQEVVVPKFENVAEAKLSPEQYKMSDYNHKTICNAQLLEQVKQDPRLREQFSQKDLMLLEKGKTPSGYIWHHDAEPGRMQLVEATTHQNTRHTGGKVIWGGGKECR